MLVSALIRRVEGAGGFAALLARGEDMGGAILVHTNEKGQFSGLFERMVDFDDVARLVPCGPPAPSDSLTISTYLEKRRASDRDLWIVELDIADAERFAAETICGG